MKALSSKPAKRSTPSRAKATPAFTKAVLASILETAAEGIITIEANGSIRTFNPAAERIFGYKADEVMGKNCAMLMPQPHRDAHDGYIQKYLTSGHARVIGIGREVVGQRKDGRTFPLYLAVSEIKSGHRHMFTGIVRDISEQRRLEEALVAVAEKERRIVGQELHDVLAQQLTAVMLMAKAMTKTCCHATGCVGAANLSELTQGALAEARRLSHGLYPVELEREGLCAALAELAESISRLFKVDCRFFGPETKPALDKTIELHIYRIAQESANNAVKHGKARRIGIGLRMAGAIPAALAIEDDGQGFNLAKTSEGMGLSIMRHRANIIGARLHVETGAGKGTTVHCTFTGPRPLHPPPMKGNHHGHS